jgi:phage major head subunit gpT-like protein
MMRGLGETAGIPEGFTFAPADRFFTEDGRLIWAEMDPTFPEFRGKREFFSIAWYEISFGEKLHKKGFKVPERDYRTDRWGHYDAIAREMGRHVNVQKRRDFIALLLDGTADRHGLAYDGQFFFDADHLALDVSGNRTTYPNLHAATPFSAANWERVRTAKETRRLRNGELVSNRADRRYHAVVGPSNRAAARDVFDLPKNGDNPHYKDATWEVWPELSGAHEGKWLVLERIDGAPEASPVIIRETQAPELVTRTNPDGDPMFYGGELEWGVNASWDIGYGRHELLDLCLP